MSKHLEAQVTVRQAFRYLNESPSRTAKETAQLFARTSGRPYNSVRRALDNAVLRGTPTFKPKNKPGHRVRADIVQAKAAVRQLYIESPECPVRVAASKVGVTKSTLQNLKKRLGIKTRVKKNAPRYVKDQAPRAKKNCRRIVEKLLPGRVLLMDDESYVPLNPQDVRNKRFVSEVPGHPVADAQRVTTKAKFGGKVLVWTTIAEGGLTSDSFYSTKTMTGQVYLEECLKKILLPFIDANWRRADVLFWMDMARPHYAAPVIDFLQKEGIPFVKWKENAPNVPQARPIERYWALCKRAYARANVASATLEDFVPRWESCAREVVASSGLALMRSARAKVRAIGRKGVYAII
jgi:hypothetical protein